MARQPADGHVAHGRPSPRFRPVGDAPHERDGIRYRARGRMVDGGRHAPAGPAARRRIFLKPCASGTHATAHDPTGIPRTLVHAPVRAHGGRAHGRRLPGGRAGAHGPALRSYAGHAGGVQPASRLFAAALALRPGANAEKPAGERHPVAGVDGRASRRRSGQGVGRGRDATPGRQAASRRAPRDAHPVVRRVELDRRTPLRVQRAAPVRIPAGHGTSRMVARHGHRPDMAADGFEDMVLTAVDLGIDPTTIPV